MNDYVKGSDADNSNLVRSRAAAFDKSINASCAATEGVQCPVHIRDLMTQFATGGETCRPLVIAESEFGVIQGFESQGNLLPDPTHRFTRLLVVLMTRLPDTCYNTNAVITDGVLVDFVAQLSRQTKERGLLLITASSGVH